MSETTNETNTSGGASVDGNVIPGNDFVGRDKNVYGDEVKGDKINNFYIQSLASSPLNQNLYRPIESSKQKRDALAGIGYAIRWHERLDFLGFEDKEQKANNLFWLAIGKVRKYSPPDSDYNRRVNLITTQYLKPNNSIEALDMIMIVVKSLREDVKLI